MKVIIGPYKNYWGPYQLAELMCFWAKKQDWVHNFGTWLAENKDGSDTALTKLCNWIYQRRVRQVYVRIDKHDTWSMDHTLAHIILPMLKQLKATKHGSPKVDDFDTPQRLWSTAAKPKQDPYDIDEFWHDRWEYVLSEMIWAFEQELNNAEEQFYNYPDPKLPIKEQLSKITVNEQALREWEHRKQRGFQLFGKYYQHLWD